MKNYDTPGMEFLHSYSIPEDRALVFKSDGANITKVWDASGQAFEIPSAKDLNMIGYFPAYRTGEYNSSGDEGFELHDENSAKTSWWTPTTGSVVFVKIASGTSRMATQINLETGALIGEAKPYIVLGNGSFHGVPEAVPGDIHFAVDINTQWAIIVSGYGSIAQTLSSLFTHKDVDMRLSLDLDCQSNLVAVRLNYAGIWYGVHKLWFPGIEENPILTGKGWYWPELIGINATCAVFLYIARRSSAQYLGLQSFDYTTLLWTTEPSPIVAGGAPVAGYSTQIETGANRYMLTLTPNNNLYMIWLQFQPYYSSGWKIYIKYVVRKRTAAGWDTAYIFREWSQPGLTPSYSALGGIFNNNDWGFAYYFNSSIELVVRTCLTGTWSAEATITTTPDSNTPISQIRIESDNNRGYIMYRNDPSITKQLYMAVYSGSSWFSTQIDDASGNNYAFEQFVIVDNAQKAMASFVQGPSYTTYAWCSRFYSSAGWGSLDIHERWAGERYMIRSIGGAYNGTKAVVAMLGCAYTYMGIGTEGLFVDLYNGTSWAGAICLEGLSNVFPTSGIFKEWNIPCYIDSAGNIYIAYFCIDSTPSLSFVRVQYYNATTSTWTATTLNTSPNDSMYMWGSGDRVLIAWAQNHQLWACIGEAGVFTSPKRISYFNPAFDYCNVKDPLTSTYTYIPPLIASYGGQNLAMMCYARDRNFPPDWYDGYYGEKEAVIANTGFFT